MSFPGTSVPCSALLTLTASSLSLVFASTAQSSVIWDAGTFYVSDLIDTNGYANNGATVFLESNVLLDGELQIHQSSEVTLSETCRVTDSVYLRDAESFFTLDGGTVRNLILHGDSNAILQSGTIEDRLELIHGNVLMRGGSYNNDEIDCGLGSILTLEGYEFTVNGMEILNGSQRSFSATGPYHVTGVLGDGSAIDVTVHLTSAILNFNANAVPGPAGAMFGLATLAVCTRRRRRD